METETKPLIYVDPNETSHSFFDHLTDKNLDFTFTKLPCDYIVDGVRGTIVIERKDYKDFVASIFGRSNKAALTNRLFDQLKDSIQAFPDSKHLYLLTGNARDSSRYSRFGMDSAFQALTSLLVDWNANILHFPKESDGAMFLANLAKRVGRDRSQSHISIPKPRLPTVKEQATFFLASLPKIGAGRAETLLREGEVFEMLQRIYVGDGKNVAGLGVSILNPIRKVLKYKYGLKEKEEGS